MEVKDLFDRRQIEVFRIKPAIKELSKRDRILLLDQLFREEFQGKSVTYEMMEKDLFVKTNARTRRHFPEKQAHGSIKGHSKKIQISAGGEYFDLITNVEYSHSEVELKENQNNFHKNTLNWHYFKKFIMCEDEYFQVMVDVQENKSHEFMVYNVSLNEVPEEYVYEKLFPKKEKELINSVPIDTDLRDKLFYEHNITQKENSVNDNIVNKKPSFMSLIKNAIFKQKARQEERKQLNREEKER